MAGIQKADRPRPGMYLLDLDLDLDATKRRAVPAGDPAARFVLGVAGGEVPAVLVDRLQNVQITDRHVSLVKSEPEPRSTGAVASAATDIEHEPEAERPDVDQAKRVAQAAKPEPAEPKKAEGK